jgi:hypothetical protein
LEALRPGYYTSVPFGGGDQPEYRGLSTSDAESKGLIVWDGGKFMSPKPSIDTEKESTIVVAPFVPEVVPTKSYQPRVSIAKFTVNFIAIVLILGAVGFLLWWLLF